MSSHAVAEASWGSGDAHVQSTATRRPRPQADGARGAPHLPLRFSTKPCPSAPWARGLLSAFWERGSPDLPACGPRRGCAAGLYDPSSSTQDSIPLRGAKPRGVDDTRLPQEQPHQAGSRGGGEIKAGVPREEPVTQAMTIKIRRPPACVVSLFPLWCNGGKRRRGVPRHQAKVAISVQRDQDQQSGRTEVTMEHKMAPSLVLLAAEDHLWSG